MPHVPNSIQIGGIGNEGSLQVESSVAWPESWRTEIRAKYNVTGDLDEYFHLPFVIEAGDVPVVIQRVDTDQSYLDMLLRFIDTTVNKKTI
jgi:hypothetical protein